MEFHKANLVTLSAFVTLFEGDCSWFLSIARHYINMHAWITLVGRNFFSPSINILEAKSMFNSGQY